MKILRMEVNEVEVPKELPEWPEKSIWEGEVEVKETAFLSGNSVS